MTIGERIRKARLSKKLSQAELGEKLNVSQAMIAQYERGKRTPKIYTIQKIAHELEVPVSSLLGWNDITFVENRQVSAINTLVEDVNENILLNFYRQLNDIGKEEAYKRIGELTLIPDYKNPFFQGQQFVFSPTKAPTD